MTIPPSLTPGRLGLLYLAFFATHGVAVPYLPVALRGAGLSGDSIGLAMAAALAIHVSTPPVWGYLADRAGLGGRLVLAAAGIAALGMGLAAWAASPSGFVAGFLVFALGRAPVGALIDALSLSHPGVGAGGYGRVRRWGSVGFILAVVSTGLVLERLAPRAIAAIVGATWVLFALVGLILGLGAAPAPAGPRRLQLERLYGSREVGLFLVASAAHAAAGVSFDTYFALHAADVGLPGSLVGAAWAVGVALEVALLTNLSWLVARLGPRRLLLVSYAVGALRWTLSAVIPGGMALAAVQALHGVTFGAFFGGSVVWLSRAVPATLRASGQAAFSAAAWGLGGIAAQLAFGPLYERMGGRAVFALAALLEVVPLAVMLRIQDPPSGEPPDSSSTA